MVLRHFIQRSFCVFFISLALILYVVHVKKPAQQRQSFARNENFSSLIGELFARISSPGNLADVASGEILDVFKLLNSSLGLENDTGGTFSGLNNAKHVHILGKSGF